MKIGVCFFGIVCGDGGGHNDKKDIRHCWSNVNSMLIEPFKEKEHEIDIFFSTYPIADQETYQNFEDLTNFKAIIYSNFLNSNSFTTKMASFELLKQDEQKDLDFIILTRADMHFRQKIADANIDFSKFNFLFKEKGNWLPREFTCDNFYAFPVNLLETVQQSFKETQNTFYHTTHALYSSLKNKINQNDINFINNEFEEMSDINSFYTVCRTLLDANHPLMHPEVKEKFYT